MRANIARATALLAVLWLLAAGSAAAQSPAVNATDADYAREQQKQRIEQPLNNEPVWKEIRSGEPQFTSIPGRETNVLIEPRGQTWRALRSPMVGLGGLLLALAIGGLAVFYMWRGTMDYESARNERYIRRFSPLDRYAHWLVAIVWVLLAITGLILSIGKSVLLPLVGYNIFSILAAVLASRTTVRKFPPPRTTRRRSFPRSGNQAWPSCWSPGATSSLLPARC